MAKRKPKPRGLGDTIEKITEATGIKSAVKMFADLSGIDCGCEERKEALNKLFPYKKVNCLNQKDYEYLKEFFAWTRNELSGKVQRELSAIYQNTFGISLESSCASCWRDYIGQLRIVYDQYKQED